MHRSRGVALSVVLGGLLAAVWLGACGGASADEDQDRARDAVRDGRALPLERIVEKARTAFGGDVLDVELEDEDDALRYELKVMTADGRILKLEYDAATGDLLRVKGRHRNHEERR
ncbi:PepSY domain-containing protein [Azospirillum sp.]|uniref:PepSY domain-containing protein n=1 Tax=Azospirillum sp. TaxID=34012 RepID=UPI002D5395B7|nr:PepSY domain-containing protein [Azospirillum sp.]HYD65383.1 PepSY domain-containing protein [Azospirillum sp.]